MIPPDVIPIGTRVRVVLGAMHAGQIGFVDALGERVSLFPQGAYRIGVVCVRFEGADLWGPTDSMSTLWRLYDRCELEIVDAVGEPSPHELERMRKHVAAFAGSLRGAIARGAVQVVKTEDGGDAVAFFDKYGGVTHELDAEDQAVVALLLDRVGRFDGGRTPEEDTVYRVAQKAVRTAADAQTGAGLIGAGAVALIGRDDEGLFVVCGLERGDGSPRQLTARQPSGPCRAVRIDAEQVARIAAGEIDCARLGIPVPS